MAAITSFFACKKKETQATCIAGMGGNVTIVAFPQHHGNPILNRGTYLDSAFVKFNTKDFPGNKLSNYDTVFVGEAGEDHVHLRNLTCGSYYIWMTGFDTTSNQRVTGGLPYEFSKTSGEIELIVAVTE